MTLRTKTLLIVGLVLSTLLMGMFYTSRTALRARFAEIERQDAEDSSGRTRAVMASMLDEVDAIGLEWAHNPNPAEVQLSRGMSARGVFDALGHPMSLMGWDNGSRTDFPASLLEYVRIHGLPPAAKAGGARGLVPLADGDGGVHVMLVSVHPIRDDDGQNLLIVGSWLDPERLARLAQVNAMMVPEPPDADVDAARAVELDSENGQVIIRTDPSGETTSTTLLRDLAGKPALSLRCFGRRLVSEQASMAVTHVGTDLAVAGVVSTSLVFLLLGWLVLGRLERVSRDLDAISRGDRKRVEVQGSDELSRVALAVNRTLEALDKSHAHLVESEARFRSMADSSPLGVYLCGPDGTPQYINPACERMIGQDAETVTQRQGWSKAVHSSDQERVLRNWTAGIASRRAFHEHYRMVHPDGKVVWVTSNAAPIIRDGELAGFVGTLEDTTERLQAQADLQRAKLAAEAANHAKSEFLANMSHEIRTPMTAILGFADLLAEPSQDERSRQSCIETIRRNGEHLLSIINDILDVSRIEAGRMTVEKVACSPGDIATEVALLLDLRARTKRISLCVDFDGPVPATIQCDPLRLRQMLTNLVGNAVKFTEEGSVRVLLRMEGVTKSNRGSAPRLCIDVIDTGIGLSAEQIPLLFKPFSQADNSMARRFGGTGLGLSICAKLAAILGGELSVRSMPGKGSTFSLRLDTGPLEGVAMIDTPRREPPALRKAPGPTQATLNARVLFAEDGPDNQRLISFLLIRAGAQVDVAPNGLAAVEMALNAQNEGRPFDLILMDMQMPQMDGYTATRTLRQKGYKGTIVALTAHAMAEDRAKCVEAGCDDFASKPIDRDSLIAKCAQWARREANAA